LKTAMKRGDVIVVASAVDYSKLNSAVIVQTDAFPVQHASVVVHQMASKLVDAPDFRVTIEPRPGNGLRSKFQIMADKPVTVRRERIGQFNAVDAVLGTECHPFSWVPASSDPGLQRTGRTVRRSGA
jgi:mRNA interferase MazF